jgi:hypothetical protein
MFEAFPRNMTFAQKNGCLSTDQDEASRQPPIVQRRNRPQMTLMFGVNTSEKTLMFATNSPFGLNDCVEINPGLSLERQE